MTVTEPMNSKLLSLTDSLGEEFMSSFSAETRRATGSTYTPFEIVNSMVRESAGEIDPDYVVDCGCGSGRFSLAAAMMFPRAKVYAVDNSPLACTMCSENVRRPWQGSRFRNREQNRGSTMKVRYPWQNAQVRNVGRYADIPWCVRYPWQNAQVRNCSLDFHARVAFGTHGKTPRSETGCYQCAS